MYDVDHHSENLVQGRQQGLTNAVLFCDQMALGVFLKMPWMSKNRLSGFEKTFG